MELETNQFSDNHTSTNSEVKRVKNYGSKIEKATGLGKKVGEINIKRISNLMVKQLIYPRRIKVNL